MISKADIKNLNEYRSAPGRVLSVYLDVDQSNAANMNRAFDVAFETQVKATQRTFEAGYETRDFDEALSKVRGLLSKYKPAGRGLVIFARSTGPVWFRELSVPLTTEIRWGQAAHVLQFLEAMDEFQTYGVVLLDKTRARVFTAGLGEIETHADIYALGRVRHMKTTGTDHLYSQSHFQHAADERELSYLKRVVEMLEHVSTVKPFQRLVLAGTTEAMSNLFRLLPKIMRARVVASAVLSANAPDKGILDLVLSLAGKAERAHEIEEVEKLLTTAAKGGKAVTMLPKTLRALNEKRVRELVYSEGFAIQGGVCDSCEAVFPRDSMNCEFCGLPVKPAADLLESAIGAALSKGSAVEQVRGEAAERLRTAGGIGAFLRF